VSDLSAALGCSILEVEIMFECEENKGNRLDVDSEDGEAMITFYSKEMQCELVVCLSQESTDKFKKVVSKL